MPFQFLLLQIWRVCTMKQEGYNAFSISTLVDIPPAIPDATGYNAFSISTLVDQAKMEIYQTGYNAF